MRASSLLKLHKLLTLPFFTTADAKNVVVSRQVLARLAKKGILERISPGLYRAADYEFHVDFEWEKLALSAATIPEGVICLISALCYYDLSDQIMREAWIAIPHRLKAPRRTGVRIVRMRNIDLGKTKIKMGEFAVQIFDRERCVVDAFRYLDKEIAIKTMKSYLFGANYNPQLNKLSQYASALRVNLTPYILALTIVLSN